ncbi:MAG: flagellin [Lachnospiraceae bacterium]|nr:flagellin [Lachnospiraceae bacterium]
MVISHNLTAMNAKRQSNIVGIFKTKSTEKLSSGYKINRAADDAAGLTISENMRRKIRGLNQAAYNVQDGTSYCQIAEGALAEISDMLNRIEELSVKSANGTNTDEDREALDKEMQQLVSEMDRVFKSTEFNTLKIWPPVIAPIASGAPEEYSLYKVKDATGEYYGGIEYMGHNYSWNDLGVGWDPVSHTFTETEEYDITDRIVSGLSTASTIDDYNGKASFNIRTQKGEALDSMIKTYSWNADDEGIRIDGILVDEAKWSSGNFDGITPGGKAKAGDYSFNFYGQRIEFGIPEDMSFSDMLTTINDKLHFDIEWTSSPAKARAIGSVLNITANNTRIYIDADRGGKKDNIAKQYNVVADNDKLVIKNSDGDRPEGTVWTNLDNTGPAGDGMYGFGSWGTDVNGNGSSKSDTINGGDDNGGSSALAIDEDAKFTYSTDFFGKTNRGGLGFDFNIKENQTKTDILQDFNSSYFSQSSILSPTTAYTNDKTQEIWVSASSSNISFYTQRDTLGRNYNNSTEEIAKGSIAIDADGTYKAVLQNGGKIYELTSSVSASSFADEILNNCRDIEKEIYNKYSADAEVKRKAYYDAWLSDSSRNHFNDLSSFRRDGTAIDMEDFLVQYSCGVVISSVITEYLDDMECDEIWGSAYTDNITYVDETGTINRKSDDEIKALKEQLWENTDSNDKHDIWKDSSKISDSDKEIIWSGLDISHIGYREISSFMDSRDIDALVGFARSEQESIYNEIRDNYIDNGVIGNKLIKFNGSKNGDVLNLTFDLSNIKVRDIMAEERGFLEFNEKNPVTESKVKRLLDNNFADSSNGTKFNLKADGASYQDVRFYQGHKSSGTKADNDVSVVSSPVLLDIQSGAEKENVTTIKYDHMRAAKLGLAGEHIDTAHGARRVMDKVISAQNMVNAQRSQFGAYINGFEHCYDNINNTVENTQAAESLIRDTDMADEMVKYTRSNILEQAVFSMLSQANQTNQEILLLLR